ncbi:MAG TPA: hypothetical protein VM925_11290, partial [Labilithrix sp.]|nr:hypothetical protein [Labilithrix sp.]
MLDGTSGPASLETPAAVTIDEEEEAVIVVPSSGIHRFDVEGLPPGARFDGKRGTLTFRPDFTQSGSYTVRVTGYGSGRPAGFAKTVPISIEVRDSITPPAPAIVNETIGAGFKRLVVRQTTDAFLDSPGRAGRTLDAIVVVPSSATKSAPAPVIVSLHGFAAGPNTGAASTTAFLLEPHDPDNTYWWGNGDSQGHVHGYTTRRVLHLVDWLRRTYPGADADRVFATGASMGGAGIC